MKIIQSRIAMSKLHRRLLVLQRWPAQIHFGVYFLVVPWANVLRQIVETTDGKGQATNADNYATEQRREIMM